MTSDFFADKSHVEWMLQQLLQLLQLQLLQQEL